METSGWKKCWKKEIWTGSSSDKADGDTWLGDYACKYVSKAIGGMTMMEEK
jgi:hypothetical protein